MSYLLIGCGGLGCELAKCIAANESVLPGLETLHLLDFDTIEVSNLNRQLLFNSSHVGKSKAGVAKEIINKINPTIKVVAHVKSVFSDEFDKEFFGQMKLVLNALDNNKARSYVSKMSTEAGIDLIDGGSAGFLGQVRWYIAQSQYECFNCYPAPEKKTYASCTIRNNPTEFVHCVVWAKYLFNTLFGNEDHNQDFFELNNTENGGNGSEAKSFQNLFNKIFLENIKSIEIELSESIPTKLNGISLTESSKNDKISEYSTLFEKLYVKFSEKHKEEGALKWIKEDDDMVKFIYAVANLRAYVFNLPFETEFQTKTIAGNIIPSVVTTNAIVSGLMLNEVSKYFTDKSKLRNVYVCSSSANEQYLAPTYLPPFKKDCLVCQNVVKSYSIGINFRLPIFQTLIPFLKQNLLMQQVEIMDNYGQIILCVDDDEEEAQEIYLKYDSKVNLVCNDFAQGLKAEILAVDRPSANGFEIIADRAELNGTREQQGTVSKKEKLVT